MIRDSLLAVSGRLDLTRGGSLVQWKNDEYVPEDKVSEDSLRRTVYLPIVRDRVFDALTIFDFANPSVGVSKRTPTVVSHQALFFLNSPLAKASARAWAQSLLAGGATTDSELFRAACERAFGREPQAGETERAIHFLEQTADKTASGGGRLAAWSALCQVMLASNEFCYRD